LARARRRDPGEPDAAKIVECQHRQAQFAVGEPNSSSEPRLYVQGPPPRLPIDRHPTAGSVAGDGCRLIGRAGGPIGSNAREESGGWRRGRRPASALQLPPQCRQASLGRTPRTSARRPIGEVQPIARIRLWPNDVRLDRLPKDYARCAAPGIVGGDGNSVATGFSEELHAEAFMKCDGLQI
jgi:hypothetical protein